jgi:hypothetical protein
MHTRRQFLKVAAAFPAVLLVVRPVAAATPPVFADDGIAINGYDPVAYFTDGKPVRGDKAITSDWNGAILRFASMENKARFDADPEVHAPKYGGYCAYAVSQGYTASTDPDAWTIHNGRLYLNYSKRVRRTWLENVDGYIARADENWPGVLSA